jgi:hypothetical protein
LTVYNKCVEFRLIALIYVSTVYISILHTGCSADRGIELQSFNIILLFPPAQGPVLLSLEEGPMVGEPRVEAGPRAEVGPEVEAGPRAAMASCRSCGGSGPLESFLQGKYCSSICVQPPSGR